MITIVKLIENRHGYQTPKARKVVKQRIQFECVMVIKLIEKSAFKPS